MGNILVTGGAGFIGSHVVDKFVENNHNVIIIDNESSPNSGYKNPKATYIKEDINSSAIDEIFKKYQFDVCVHLAAQPSVSASIKDTFFDAKTNILGSINILQMCKKYCCKKIITASSAAVYGNPQYLPVDEKHPTNPMSPYGLSKLTMEKYIQLFDVPYIICRFSNVYGERQNPFGEAGVVSIFAEAMANNKEIYIEGDGLQTRDFIYVKDIAKIIYKLAFAEVKNEILNVSTNTSCSINELFKVMAGVFEYSKEPVYKEARAGDIRDSVLLNSSLMALMSEVKFVDLKQALQFCKG